jgi:uncharacterized protein YdeI (YjbR/CyaY-like superfamily)
MKTMNPKVDAFLRKAPKWQDELKKLRNLILAAGLIEELKWGVPCYTTVEGSNIVLIHGFKEYCGLLFFNGALLKDAEGLLIQQTKNVQAGRQIRFTSVQEIEKMERTLKAYIEEAIEVEKLGRKVIYKKTTEFSIPPELKNKLKENSILKTAFNALTPGRQRAYLLYFSAAKQAQTRESRIEKYIPRILKGKGLNDCICGLSQKMPTCDGSHKNLR